MQVPACATAWAGIAVLLVATGLRVSVAGNSQDDEAVPAARAASILAATERSGPHFSVDDRVTVSGYFYEFRLTSDYGPFTALGRSQLSTRIDEIRAIAALQEVSKSEVFLASAGGAVVDIGKGAASAVTDPVATAKGVGAGIKRFGVNLGRASKRAIEKEDGAETGESGATTAADTVLGVSGAMRDGRGRSTRIPIPSTSCCATRRRASRRSTPGSIVTKVVVPIPAVVGATATAGNLLVEGTGSAPQTERRARASAGRARESRVRLFPERLVLADAADPNRCRARRCSETRLSGYLQSAPAADNEREALSSSRARRCFSATTRKHQLTSCSPARARS